MELPSKVCRKGKLKVLFCFVLLEGHGNGLEDFEACSFILILFVFHGSIAEALSSCLILVNGNVCNSKMWASVD